MAIKHAPHRTARSRSSFDGGVLLAGRYRIVDRLGSGGTADVFLARDYLAAGELVALKRVPSERVNALTADALRREFRRGASLRHPHIAGARDFVYRPGAGELFLTADFVEGVDWCRATSSIDWNDAQDKRFFFEALTQVLRALAFIHECGLVHGDLKPSNVLVAGRAGEDVLARVIDLGGSIEERSVVGRRFLATPYYVAPEVATGARVDRRADLYSIGVVLYQICAGELPFRTTSPADLLRDHVSHTPPPIEARHPSVPSAMKRIIGKLLAKAPHDRFDSAPDVILEINRSFGLALPLETPPSVEARLAHGFHATQRRATARLTRTVIPTRHHATHTKAAERSDTVASARLRRGALDAPLASGCYSVECQDPELLTFVTGELARRARLAGVLVLPVDCSFARTRERLWDVLSNLTGRRDSSGAQGPVGIKQVFDALWEVARHEPVLVVEVGAGKRRDPSVERDLEALRSSMRRLEAAGAYPRRGLALVEIRQAADASVGGDPATNFALEVPDAGSALRVLRRVFRGCDVSEEVWGRSVGRGWSELRRTVLSWFDSKTLERTSEGWEFWEAVEGAGTAGVARHELRARLAGLPAVAEDLAVALAWLVAPCPLEGAACLAGLDEESRIVALDHLSSASLISSATSAGRGCEVWRLEPRLAELLRDETPEVRRKRLQRRAAETFEALYRSGYDAAAEALAEQARSTGDRERVAVFSASAARRAFERGNLSRARALYEEAIGSFTAVGSGPVPRLARELATVLIAAGDVTVARRVLGPLAERTSGGRVNWQLARALARAGAWTRAARCLERRPGHPKDSQLRVVALRVLSAAELDHYRGDYRASLRRAKRFGESEVEHADAEVDAEVIARLRLLLSENHARLGNRRLARSYCVATLRLLADAVPDRRRRALLARARARGLLLAMRLTPARRWLRRTIRLAARAGLAEDEAESWHDLAEVELARGSVARAFRASQRAVSSFRRLGNAVRLVEARARLAEIERLRGEHVSAVEIVQELLPTALRFGRVDVVVALRLTLAASSLDRGKLSEALALLAEVRAEAEAENYSGELVVRARLLSAQAAQEAGRLGEALDHARSAARAARPLRSPLLTASVLLQLHELYRLFGQRRLARTTLRAATRHARRFGLGSIGARADTLRAASLRGTNSPSRALRLLDLAERRLGRGDPRALVSVHLRAGLRKLESGELEAAALRFEEGAYLARVLDLTRARCLFALAQGQLELLRPQADHCRAEGFFRLAASLADRAGYPLEHWEASWRRGEIAWQQGDRARAREVFESSASSLHTLLRGLPRGARRGFARRLTRRNQAYRGVADQGPASSDAVRSTISESGGVLSRAVTERSVVRTDCAVPR